MSIDIQERNRVRADEEMARTRDRTVRDIENDIDEYFDLGDEDVEGKDEIAQKFRRGFNIFPMTTLNYLILGHSVNIVLFCPYKINW